MAKLINNWEELNNVNFDKYEIKTYPTHLIIRNRRKNHDIAKISYESTPHEIIKLLNAIGFYNIEYNEVTLTRQEWHCINYLPENYWISRDKDGDLYAYSKLPIRVKDCWDKKQSEPITHQKSLSEFILYQESLGLLSDLFSFIVWESAPMRVSELRKLGVD